MRLNNRAFNAGFNVETVEYKNISFTVWDVGGQDKVTATEIFCCCVSLFNYLIVVSLRTQ